MHKEYATLLEKTKTRKLDQETNEPALRDGFYNQNFPDALKYVMESLLGIDPLVSHKMFIGVRRTQDIIQRQLKNKGIFIDSRYAGPHASQTNIEIYGDLELKVILKSYEGKASENLVLLTREIIDILEKTQAYGGIDNSDGHHIYVQARKPVSILKITPAIWVDSKLFQSAHIEINRGVAEFNFQKKTRKVNLTFLNLARINTKDNQVGGSIRALIRLLRTLKTDAGESINLSDDEISGIVYNMSAKELKIDPKKMLSLLPNLSLQINQLIADDNLRQKLISPSRREYVFGQKNKKEALVQIKQELDQVIEDLSGELKQVNRSLMSPIKY